MAKMERPCPPMVMLAFPLLTILTLRGADAPAPAANAVAPLVDIIEADASGNPPHSQMYTTLLDKDGKVVDTNDPHRAIDWRYKSVEQSGEGAGLPKGDNVTVHFRMAAVTPNNADGDGTGVQEDTTYYMELPWQLVTAKQHRLRYRCVYCLR
mgnify:CR=1 FL=1